MLLIHGNTLPACNTLILVKCFHDLKVPFHGCPVLAEQIKPQRIVSFIIAAFSMSYR